MKLKVRYAILSIITALAGCVVIDGSKTEWKDEESNMSSDGPGHEDADFIKWQKNKYEYDNGHKIAVGLLPGVGEMLDQGKVHYSKNQELDSWAVYIPSMLIANCFVLPTIDSLLIEPFGDGEFSGSGLLGCHRWRSQAGTRLIENGAEEELVRESDKTIGQYARRYASASGKNSDGTKVFFLYPGLPTITEVVVREGKADVLFPGGEPKYRRFYKSDNVAGALRYEDVALAQTIDVSESVQRMLMECWADDDVPLEDKASIYLLLPDKCFSSPKDQTYLAQVFSKSVYWESIFEKIQANKGLSNPAILLAFAQGREFKGVGNGSGDERVAMWAIENLSDEQLKQVVRSSDVTGACEKALGRIVGAGTMLELLLDVNLAKELKEQIVARLPDVNATEDIYRDLYLQTKEFWLAKIALQKLSENVRLTQSVSGKMLQWLRDEEVSEDDRAHVAKAVVGEKALVSLVLDKDIARQFREAALEKISEESKKTVYCAADEYWLAEKTLSGLPAGIRGQDDVVTRTHAWLKDASVSLADRVVFFLAQTDRAYDQVEQQIIAKMLGLTDWRGVFEKCKKENAINDSKIRMDLMDLAMEKLSVDDEVALWAVEGLSDVELLSVVEVSSVSKVGFKAVRLLRDPKSVEKIALGSYGAVVRLEAINRLTAVSKDALRQIATGNDSNFRKVALDRIEALGLVAEDVKADADQVAKKEEEARALEAEKLRNQREAAIGKAEREIALAKTDEAITAYRVCLSEGKTEGLKLSFTGRILSIVSRSWKPKIRIEIKGAKETLYAVCHGTGRFNMAVKEGDSVVVDGTYSGGTDAEVSITDVRFSVPNKVNAK